MVKNIVKKRNCTMDFDRISDLPGNIKDIILGCLPLRDAVRTSILSRRWRNSCVNLPKLVFDDMLLEESIINQPSARDKLVSAIYQVLLRHRGPVTEFKLSITQLESCPDIDQFILYLSWNAVEKLSLHILKYKLPTSLYSCLQLKHLILDSCIFKPPPTFRGFSRLVNLEFYGVTFHSEKFGSFISNCVLLERLTVKSDVAYQSFTINAPKLKYLHLKRILNPVCFKSAPLLEVLEIYPSEGGVSSNIELFRSLPIIEDVKINYLFLKSLAAGDIPEKRLNLSIPLKVLEIFNLCFGELDEVSSTLGIIRSSTKLQKLTIQMYDSGNSDTVPVLELLKAQYYSEINLDQLREVKLRCVAGAEVELEFIKLLLATSALLENILIEVDLGKVADKGLSMLKKLLQFERLSNKAKIIIIEDPPPKLIQPPKCAKESK